MKEFLYETGPARIEFGRGKLQNVSATVESLGCSRAMVLSTQPQRDKAEMVADLLGSKAAGIFSGAQMHTPVSVTEAALSLCESKQADCLVAIGGGSTTGLSKALAHRNPLPQIIIPTTYAGSEVTPVLGQTEGGIKTTLKSMALLPDAVIYDPDLTMGLPLAMSISSGLNAMAHAAEGLYARDRNPISSLLAAEGIGAMKTGLTQIAVDAGSIEGRDAALYAAWLCGTVLGQVGMALHHKICHTLGGSFGMPHAETHAVMLPHTIGFNAQTVAEQLSPIDRIFDDEPGPGLFAFSRTIGAPTSLKALGFKAADLDRAAQMATANPYWNPQPFDRVTLRALLQNAFDGAEPPRREH